MVKINQNIILKSLALLLCFYIAIAPFFQPRKAHASMSDKLINFTRVAVEVIMGLKAVGFIADTTLTPENLENIYNKADAYLHENFGTELEYAEALRQVDQLGLDIASGKVFVPGNYSGKLWYSFLNAVVDVVWPKPKNSYTGEESMLYLGTLYGYSIFVRKGSNSLLSRSFSLTSINSPSGGGNAYFNSDKRTYYPTNINLYFWKCDKNIGATAWSIYTSDSAQYFYAYVDDSDRNFSNIEDYVLYTDDASTAAILTLLSPSTRFVYTGNESSNLRYVIDMSAKTANKVKLPTRLPQSVINNINNYIDNSTENLIIAPTADELPTLPDNYNPSTDDPPDLPGYEDVTPDQPGTTDPEPTPTPPDPTPTPPEYDGSNWIKPIGDFFAGLLSFLKDALIPTQTVDVTPLQNMGADVSSKFPFSLPGDIGKLFGVLNAEPIRPHFEMDFDLSKVGIPGEPIHWDLNVEQWDNGAAVVKTALYIAFLIGLVFITKQFMQN